MESKYRVEKCIGRGNYGTVYLVHSIQTKKQYVLKRISFENMPSKDQTHVAAEVQMLSRLNHPNIVTYKEHMQDDENLFIIMGYCEDGDLHSKIKEASRAGVQFSEEQILKWFVQMVLALKHVHKNRILHRDLKTQNIFLTRKSKVIKLGDFGISKVLDGTLDMAKTVIGTPYYMSPELCENQPYGKASDVWSLGCILYELCVLKHAFDATNICGLIFKILNGSYPPIPESYSPELRGLVAQMLSRKPEERPRLESIIEMDFIKPAMTQLRADIMEKTPRNGDKQRPHTTTQLPQHTTSANSTARLVDTVTRPATSAKDEVLQRKKADQLARDQHHNDELKAARKAAQKERLKAVNRERQQFLSTLSRPGSRISEDGCNSPLPSEEGAGKLADPAQHGGQLDEIITQNAGEALQNGALADGQAFAMQGSPSEADQLDEDYDSDFESYSDDFESDNDEEKVASELEKTVDSSQETPHTPATAKLVAEPIANHVVNDKAATFREECESKLGIDKLALIYGILMQRWNGECTNDADIKARLAEVTVKADEQHFMLVDQLIYFENMQTNM